MAPATVPYLDPAEHITLTASAAIIAGQLVEVTGNLTVGPAGADSVKCVGQALADAAVGAPVSIVTVGVVWLTASGAITAGAPLVCGAAGTVKLAATGGGAYAQAETTFYQRLVGRAVEAIGDTLVGRVKLTAL